MIHFRDVRLPVTSDAFVPVTKGEVMIQHTGLGRINRAHGTVEVVHANKGEVRSQATGLLQIPFHSTQISLLPCFEEFPASGNRIQERGTLAAVFLYPNGCN